MAKLPNLPPAGVVRGVLHWYAGDVFDLSLTLFLRREDGLAYTPRETDRLRLEIFDCRGDLVLTREFSGEALLAGQSAYTVTLPVGTPGGWTPAVGRYRYRLQVLTDRDGAWYTAAVADNEICVEGDACR